MLYKLMLQVVVPANANAVLDLETVEEAANLAMKLANTEVEGLLIQVTEL